MAGGYPDVGSDEWKALETIERIHVLGVAIKSSESPYGMDRTALYANNVEISYGWGYQWKWIIQDDVFNQKYIKTIEEIFNKYGFEIYNWTIGVPNFTKQAYSRIERVEDDNMSVTNLWYTFTLHIKVKPQPES